MKPVTRITLVLLVFLMIMTAPTAVLDCNLAEYGVGDPCLDSHVDILTTHTTHSVTAVLLPIFHAFNLVVILWLAWYIGLQFPQIITLLPQTPPPRLA
jgi:hypothetical protein